MGYKDLFDTQRLLDNKINEQHPIKFGDNRKAKKILALQIEIAELGNEMREVFKFWSSKKNNMEKALKEYVDSIHFLLSIGLDIGVIGGKYIDSFNYYPVDMHSHLSLEVTFSELIKDATLLNDEGNYIMYFCSFLGFGERLGFTEQEIINAYFEKNKENHERQHNGY